MEVLRVLFEGHSKPFVIKFTERLFILLEGSNEIARLGVAKRMTEASKKMVVLDFAELGLRPYLLGNNSQQITVVESFQDCPKTTSIHLSKPEQKDEELYFTTVIVEESKSRKIASVDKGLSQQQGFKFALRQIVS